MSTYRNKTITAIAKFYTNQGLNALTGGTWSIANTILSSLPTGVSANTSFTHRACLVENKYKTFTYILEGGSWYYGAMMQSAYYYFDNYFAFPGKSLYKAYSTPTRYVATENYNYSDKTAYYAYAMGGVAGILQIILMAEDILLMLNGEQQ